MKILVKKLEEIYESPAGSSRLIPMEGVRGFAVLLVFFVHFNALFHRWLPEGGWSSRIWDFLGNVGHSGVDLFFVLSGFLIYGTLISRKTPMGTYALRRVQRIYPPFLAVFALYLALSAVFPGENKIPSGLLPASTYLLENLLLLPGIFDITPMISVTWSLSYEIFYYLLIPLLVIGLGMRDWSRRSRIVFFAILAGAYLAFCTLEIYPRLQLVMFLSGILLFEILRASPPAPVQSTWKRDLIGLFSLLACFPIAHLVMAKSPALESFTGGHGWFLKVTVQFLLFLVFLLACFRSSSFLGRLFSGRFIRYLGNMSYSYYLLHGLALKFLALIVIKIIGPASQTPHEWVFWLALPAGFAATWVSSTVLFIAVEKRFSLPAVRPARAPTEVAISVEAV